MKKIVLVMSAITALMVSGCVKKVGEFDASKTVGYKANTQQSSSSNEKNNTIADDLITKIEASASTTSVNNSNVNLSNTDEQLSHEKMVLEIQKKLKSIYFDYNNYIITEESQKNLIDDIAILKHFKSDKVTIEGNCDEIGSDEYNYALGLKRANAVKEWLITQGSDVKLQLSVMSFGEDNPICNEHTQACWQQNRRVELKVH